MADAYGNTGPGAAKAILERDRIQELLGRDWSTFTELDHQAAFQAFVFAEQWETSYADSNPGKVYERKSRRNAALFREVRLYVYGKSVLESALEEAVSIDVHDPAAWPA